ncbi:hypothetical protein FHW67_002705 [Herbaspirillum sp. Sphag1AN]|nr:hypothetical protein [Herbaspirillum sp. Sphag1AN]MBB3246543.1 hypothetical protein [Herbaspirillum sp. Sphag64]
MARIQNGIVVEMLTADPFPPFNPALTWVECDSTVQVGDIYDGTNFSAPTVTLAAAQSSQIGIIVAAYQSAISTPVSFTTAGGVTKTFQADSNSQDLLVTAVAGYNAQKAVPTGFYWKSADNTQVPFTLADLNGLSAAMLAQGWTAFQHLTTLKAQVAAATTVAAVQAIVW